MHASFEGDRPIRGAPSANGVATEKKWTRALKSEKSSLYDREISTERAPSRRRAASGRRTGDDGQSGRSEGWSERGEEPATRTRTAAHVAFEGHGASPQPAAQLEHSIGCDSCEAEDGAAGFDKGEEEEGGSGSQDLTDAGLAGGRSGGTGWTPALKSEKSSLYDRSPSRERPASHRQKNGRQLPAATSKACPSPAKFPVPSATTRQRKEEVPARAEDGAVCDSGCASLTSTQVVCTDGYAGSSTSESARLESSRPQKVGSTEDKSWTPTLKSERSCLYDKESTRERAPSRRRRSGEEQSEGPAASPGGRRSATIKV